MGMLRHEMMRFDQVMAVRQRSRSPTLQALGMVAAGQPKKAPKLELIITIPLWLVSRYVYCV
jgi:hypothetical protein